MSNFEVYHDYMRDFIINNECRLTNIQCRSRAGSRDTLQNSIFVNRYSLFKNRNFARFKILRGRNPSVTPRIYKNFFFLMSNNNLLSLYGRANANVNDIDTIRKIFCRNSVRQCCTISRQ
jgi:hypothetical protein